MSRIGSKKTVSYTHLDVYKRQVVIQETRGFDANTGKTLGQRSKEFAHDYRYFPEPDLPPVVITEAYIQNVRENMPKLPKQLISEYFNPVSYTHLDVYKRQ